MGSIPRSSNVINAELRPGSQHCQKHTPEFLRETVALCKKVTDEPLMFRMDSGNDSADNVGILLENGCNFIIKRNLRKESHYDWLEHVQPVCQNISHPREGKDVYIGSTWKEINGSEDVPMRKKTRRRRLRTVILNIIYAPAHVTTHARQVFASLGRSNAWAETFLRVNSSFQCCYN